MTLGVWILFFQTPRVRAFSVVVKPGEGSSGLQAQVQLVPRPMPFPRRHKQPSAEAKFDNCQIKPHALKRHKKGGSRFTPTPAPQPLNWNQTSPSGWFPVPAGRSQHIPSQPGPSACRCLRNANGHGLGEGPHKAPLWHLLPIRPPSRPRQTPSPVSSVQLS